jgi:hypothetical protein
LRALHHLLLTKEDSMLRCKMSGPVAMVFLFAAALNAVPAFAAGAAAPQAVPQAVPTVAFAAVPVTCGLNLPDLNQTVKGEVCTAEPESKVPEFLANSKKRLGYCHCGCVNERVCRTSADCGGASCDQFISCC